MFPHILLSRFSLLLFPPLKKPNNLCRRNSSFEPFPWFIFNCNLQFIMSILHHVPLGLHLLSLASDTQLTQMCLPPVQLVFPLLGETIYGVTKCSCDVDPAFLMPLTLFDPDLIITHLTTTCSSNCTRLTATCSSNSTHLTATCYNNSTPYITVTCFIVLLTLRPPVPVFLQQLSSLPCSSGISFTPHETGIHRVNVYKDRSHIPGSPFKIEVSRNEVGDASKVRVYGEGLYRGMPNQINEFVVDTRDAGMQKLSHLIHLQGISHL